MNRLPDADGLYSTGAVVLLLGIPEHVLRYWERTLLLLHPQRSFGRRRYSDSEIALLFRVRHLVRDRGLGLESVQSRLIAEGSGGRAETAARFAEIRVELIRSWFAAHELRRHASRILGPEPVSAQQTAQPPQAMQPGQPT
ncbi:MAG: MerR family transcriptional regulator [Spirochaetes bacterium]|nr:MerR family transcriptional regulator [Spirochaetota bacterium]MBU0954505.1 MerR family transcriptional regulator [Spirochaetota bacterium]